MDIVIVDAGDVGVRNDNEGEVAESLDSVGEADGQEGKGEVGGGKEGGCGGGWRAMSVHWVLADGSLRAGRTMGDTTGRGLLVSKDEVVEMPDGRLDHCRYSWTLGGVTMVDFWVTGG